MDTLEQRMKRAGILEEDLEERFVLGSGSGGQKINKTASCVYLKHVPTRIEVSCQDSRSRERNREIARSRLCSIFEKQEEQKRLDRAKKRAVQRYKKRKPSKAEKERRRQNKQHRAEKKRFRGKIRDY
ncbi:MAG: peptide chain release factor-like protein [Verrucomicrobiales bacterium]|nr:peptide chain release factor-like protein [Verrucomicrobiales bacterium]